MMISPIVLFVYNRLDVLKRTVEALQRNVLANQSELFIFSDGPKKGQEQKVKAVRRYIHQIDGLKNITIIESDINKGLACSIIEGVTKVVQEYGRVIVLEDDLVTSPYFLKFSNEALNMYQDDSDVIATCAWNYAVPCCDEKTFFLKGADCLGWATWRRGWDLFEKDSNKLLHQIKQQRLEKEFDLNGSYPYMQMLNDQKNGLVDSWAIRWRASAFVHQKLCLYPTKSLIEHIGNTSDATHCQKEKDPMHQVMLDIQTKDFPRIAIVENDAMKQAWEKHFRKTVLNGHIYSWIRYMRSLIKGIFKKVSK